MNIYSNNDAIYIEVIVLKYYSIGNFANRIGKSIQTLRNWDKKGELKPSHVTKGGTRYYSQKQIENVKTYMIAKGYQFEVITDIGSGINYNKKGLNKLIDMVINSEVDKIVILYKDRLIRFGFELIKNLCDKYGTTIEIIDNTEKIEEQELVEDLIQIVTVFSCRLQGKRANKAKKMIKELTEDD